MLTNMNQGDWIGAWEDGWPGWCGEVNTIPMRLLAKPGGGPGRFMLDRALCFSTKEIQGMRSVCGNSSNPAVFLSSSLLLSSLELSDTKVYEP